MKNTLIIKTYLVMKMIKFHCHQTILLKIYLIIYLSALTTISNVSKLVLIRFQHSGTITSRKAYFFSDTMHQSLSNAV